MTKKQGAAPPRNQVFTKVLSAVVFLLIYAAVHFGVKHSDSTGQAVMASAAGMVVCGLALYAINRPKGP